MVVRKIVIVCDCDNVIQPYIHALVCMHSSEYKGWPCAASAILEE